MAGYPRRRGVGRRAGAGWGGRCMQMALHCRECRAQIEEGLRYCPHCGIPEPYAPEGERVGSAARGGPVIDLGSAVLNRSLVDARTLDSSTHVGPISIGSVVHVAATPNTAEPPRPAPAFCPLCGRRLGAEVFRCVRCGRGPLCMTHWIRSSRCCSECAEKERPQARPAARQPVRTGRAAGLLVALVVAGAAAGLGASRLREAAPAPEADVAGADATQAPERPVPGADAMPTESSTDTSMAGRATSPGVAAVQPTAAHARRDAGGGARPSTPASQPAGSRQSGAAAAELTGSDRAEPADADAQVPAAPSAHTGSPTQKSQPNARYCTVCGARVGPGASFCTRCKPAVR